ncbi:MAG: YicC family protein [Bacteroidetes bacterium]|nr:YicC family protein [Bacteroidota bacterium]
MTGFGKSTGELPNKKITVEIKSLNSRQFDLNLRIPGLYREKESELRSELSKQTERGKIDFGIFSEYTGEANVVSINKPLAKGYYNELKKLSSELNEPAKDILSLIMKMPDVLKSDRQELDKKEWEQVRKLIDEAIKDFQKFRDDEGTVLKKEFINRINLINKLLEDVIKLDEERIPLLREKLNKGVNELKEKIDQNRFEQELIYYIEKLDISEERLRLKTHLDYFLKTMTETSSGRKLGFISQEIGREINTIGSKANDAGIQKLVVQMKDELEKIKEQLLNVL